MAISIFLPHQHQENAPVHLKNWKKMEPRPRVSVEIHILLPDYLFL